MKRRLAWLSPWNARSAIATFGAHVTEEFHARGWEVTILRTEVGTHLDEPPLPAKGEVIAAAAMPVLTLGQAFDGVVANIGDNYAFHGGAIPLLRQVPCLHIYHDGFLANLAQGWAHAQPGSPQSALRRLVVALYGEEAWEAGRCPIQDASHIAGIRPMTQWLASAAAGVVTHSQFWVPRLRETTAGRVDVLPLAYPDSEFPPPPPPFANRPLVIATIGHVNVNKRCDEVLRAIASDRLLRERCVYRLLGHVTPAERTRLEHLAAMLDVPPPHFAGWLSDDDLRREMADVDVIACLRDPVLEAGSASLIVAMGSGRPVLISNQGVYAEVPGNLVLACEPGRESGDVAAHLRGILANRQAAATIGRHARRYALETFSACRYVDGLLPAIDAAARIAPTIKTVRRMGAMLGGYGISPGSPLATRLAHSLENFL